MKSQAMWTGANPTAEYTPISRKRSYTLPIMVLSTISEAIRMGMNKLAMPEKEVIPSEL